MKSPVEPVHEVHIGENEDYEHIDGALLSKPEAKFESAYLNLVEFFNEEDSAAVWNDEPDSKQHCDIAQVDLPVGVFQLSGFIDPEQALSYKEYL